MVVIQYRRLHSAGACEYTVEDETGRRVNVVVTDAEYAELKSAPAVQLIPLGERLSTHIEKLASEMIRS